MPSLSDAPIRTFSLYFADCAHNTAVNWFKFRDHFVSSLLSRFFAKSSRPDRMESPKTNFVRKWLFFIVPHSTMEMKAHKKSLSNQWCSNSFFQHFQNGSFTSIAGFIHMSMRDCIQLTPHFTVDNFASKTDWNFNVFHTFCFLSRASYPQIFVKLLQRIRKDCQSKRPLALHVRCKRSFFLVFWSETSLIENKPRILADRKSFICLWRYGVCTLFVLLA